MHFSFLSLYMVCQTNGIRVIFTCVFGVAVLCVSSWRQVAITTEMHASLLLLYACTNVSRTLRRTVRVHVNILEGHLRDGVDSTIPFDLMLRLLPSEATISSSRGGRGNHGGGRSLVFRVLSAD